MPKMPGKKLPYILDKLGMGAGAAARHVDSAGGRTAGRRAAAVVRRMKPGTAARAGADTGVRVGMTGLTPAERVAMGRKVASRDALIAARQRTVASRYAAGALGLGSVGMYNSRSSGGRGGPRPMTRARPGSGRNP
jgi:hypothetical protein